MASYIVLVRSCDFLFCTFSAKKNLTDQNLTFIVGENYITSTI